MRRRLARIVIPAAAGAVLLGGAGWLLGPWWAIAGALAGPVAAYSVLLIILARGKPDPVRLLRAGRPQEAYQRMELEVSFYRGLAAKRPMFRDVLADSLETISRALQALDNEPQALEAATEAAAIYTDLTEKRPGQYSAALARTLLQQAALLAHLGRHGEALAAIDRPRAPARPRVQRAPAALGGRARRHGGQFRSADAGRWSLCQSIDMSDWRSRVLDA
jgi:hypothetical protein